MIETIVAAIMAFSLAQPQGLITVEPVMNVAHAAVNEVIVGNIPKPEIKAEAKPEEQTPAEEQAAAEPAPELTTEEAAVAEASEEEFYSEPQEDLPPPADSFEESSMTPLGVYHVTHYSAEGCGNAIGARGRPGGLIEGESIAMPEAWMLGHTVMIEGYGFYTVDDISPDGVADIFHWYEKDAVGEDWREVYLVK